MVSPAKARQIGFFACLIIGFLQIILTIVFMQDFLNIKPNYIDRENIYDFFDVSFPMLFIWSWYLGRKLGTKVLIDGEPVYKTAFRTMIILITATISLSIVCIMIYFLIVYMQRNGDFPEKFKTDVGFYIIGVVFGTLGLTLINLLPSVISASILSKVFSWYK